MHFSFFASEIAKTRRYHSVWPYWQLIEEFLAKPGVNGSAQLISTDEGGSDTFDASHLVWAADENEIDIVESEYGIQLPQDYKSFLTTWGQALLVFREAYWLMPPAEILRVSRDWRDEIQGSSGPCNVVRFARYWDNEERHFCFINTGGEWKIGFRDDYVFPTDDDDVTGEEAESCITDQSFTDWLTRMIATDGTPWFPGADEEFHVRTKRIQ